MKRKEALGKAGLDFEKFLVEMFKGRIVPTKGSHKWDAYTSNGVPISIKNPCMNGTNEISFADIFRQSQIEEPYFYLMVGFWEGESGDNHMLGDMYVLKIDTGEWTKLFDMETVNGYRKLLKLYEDKYIGHKKSPESWQKTTEVGRNKWASRTNNLIRPRPKWHSDTSSRRVHCVMRQKDFFDKFLNDDKIIISKSKIDMRKYREHYAKFLNIENNIDKTKDELVNIQEDIHIKEVKTDDRYEREITIKRSIQSSTSIKETEEIVENKSISLLDLINNVDN